jgi:hypothetical protein
MKSKTSNKMKKHSKSLTQPRPKKTQILIGPIIVPESFFTDNNLPLALFDSLPPGTEIPTTESIVSKILTPAQRRSAAWKLDGEVSKSKVLTGISERVMGLDVKTPTYLKTALQRRLAECKDRGIEEGIDMEGTGAGRIDKEGMIGLQEMGRGDKEEELGMVVVESEVRRDLGWE